MDVVRTVKYEEELDSGFAARVAREPGGEAIWDCLQCGTCSAICPVSVYMDRTPRRIIGLIRGGFRDEVLGSLSIWICTSCYACTVECPQKIRITDIMYIAKRMAMKESSYHRFVVPAVEEAFVKMVRKNGRLTESRMGIKVVRKSGIRSGFEMLPIAWRLMRKHRMAFLRTERMEHPASLRMVLDALEDGRPAAATAGATTSKAAGA
jgi:heterodisulfide reductase subunit C2